MKSKPKIPYKDLACYQDNLLLMEERERIESELRDDPESQRCLDQLEALDRTLHSLGRRERIREQIHATIKRSSAISEPSWRDGYTFFPLKTLASCAVVLVCLFGVWIASNNGSQKISVLQKTGQISWNDSQTKQIRLGDQIVSGKDSYAQIGMADGRSIMEVGPDSTVTLLERRQIRVDRGVVCNHVGKDPSHPYQVQTPNGTVIVLGTVFEIEVSQGQTGVRVLEGKVQIVPKDKSVNSIAVSAGYQATLKENSISPLTAVQPDSFAPWRNKYSTKNLDIQKIADVISDSKAQH